MSRYQRLFKRDPHLVNEIRSNERDAEFVRIRHRDIYYDLFYLKYDYAERSRRGTGWKEQSKNKCQFGGSREKIYEQEDPVLYTEQLYDGGYRE